MNTKTKIEWKDSEKYPRDKDNNIPRYCVVWDIVNKSVKVIRSGNCWMNKRKAEQVYREQMEKWTNPEAHISWIAGFIF